MSKTNQNKTPQKKGHPLDFDVSGPSYLATPAWLETMRSGWINDSQKRKMMACIVHTAYLLEVDRQENRKGYAALAPKWCKFFKYRVVEILVDKRDGSIFGATLEWTGPSWNFRIMKPFNAPQKIIALRGTMLRGPTIMVDVKDDWTLFITESLGGSHRFNTTLKVVRRAVGKYGNNEVAMAGHSLGAGVILQVGRSLAMEGVFVETHLFNPPSISLPLTLRCVGDRVGILFQALKIVTSAIMPFKRKRNDDKESDNEKEDSSVSNGRKTRKWIPRLYVNCNDSISCFYSDYSEKPQNFELFKVDHKSIPRLLEESGMDCVVIKLFVIPKGGHMNLWEAHGIQQWWSEEIEPQLIFNGSTLIQYQLGSLVNVKNDLSSQD